MLTVHNDIVSAIDKGYVVALALLDLSSAFDTADHTLLLSILVNWFSDNLGMVSSLPHRSHPDIHCWLNFYISSPPFFGVPQGSGLGPVEFIAYTETTTDNFSNHHILYHLFADDTQSYDRCYVTDVPAFLSRYTL